MATTTADDAGYDPRDLFELDPVEVREVDVGMVQHYLNDVFGYGPSPVHYAYISQPWWATVEERRDYEQATEFIENGGLLGCYDIHH